MKSCTSVVFVAFLGLISLGQAFKQEVYFYNDLDQNALYFSSNIPDLTKYTSALADVTRYCVYGKWATFHEANYDSYATLIGLYSTADLYCQKFNATLVKSMRHFGANDTDTHAISLYTGDDYNKEEILVTGRAHTGITQQIYTVVGTGTADYTLFEGQLLDGKQVCWRVPYPDSFFYAYDHVRDLGLSTVGSVFRGCDIREIQAYKAAMSFQKYLSKSSN